MILQLKTLFELEGSEVEINESVPIDELEKLQPFMSFAKAVKISGRAKNHVGMVTLDFTVDAVLELECDRCLTAFERGYSFDFHHVLTRELANESDEDSDEFDEYVVCPDNTLDLSELALVDLRLSLPTKILCKEDCLGLCPKCGANLNETSCGCED